MEIEIIKEENNEIELKINNPTIAEIMRVYLNDQDIEFAAWKREHPTKPLIFRIQSSGKNVKKTINDAVSAIKKDIEKISALIKKK